MIFETNVKDIKKLILVLTGKDAEVFITYKGSSYGVSNPWHIRCDAREAVGVTHDEAANVLLKNLKAELLGKIMSAEIQIEQYKSALNLIESSDNSKPLTQTSADKKQDAESLEKPLTIVVPWQNN